MIHLEREHVEAYAFQVAKEGNSYCGDSYYATATGDYFLCVLADGLGSGKLAYEAASSVTKTVKKYADQSVDTLMDYCNKITARTRGAAVAIMKADFATKQLAYSCVGNIRCYICSPNGKVTYPLPVTGYLSGKPQIFRTQLFSYEPPSTFLLYSDGLKCPKVKTYMRNAISIEEIASYLQQQVVRTDDTTYIVGSLR